MKKHARVVSVSRRYMIAAVCTGLLFLFLGALWIDQPGLYYDEVFFVWASYPDPEPGSSGYFEILGRPMKLMDWGPGAIQRFGLLAGCCLLVRWHRAGHRTYLALGFLVFGVAAFDKLSFLWLLAALAAVTLALFPKLVLRRQTASWAVLAAVAFLIGFMPVILYIRSAGC